jgi:hypothetical protein
MFRFPGLCCRRNLVLGNLVARQQVLNADILALDLGLFDKLVWVIARRVGLV